MNSLVHVSDLRQFSCFAILTSGTLQGATVAMEPFSMPSLVASGKAAIAFHKQLA